MLPAATRTRDCPSPTTFELSIFGAGVGESLAVHLGQNEWLLIDSCIDRTTGDPAAHSYLSSIGVPANAVGAIVVTHWHEDHVTGIDRLIASYTDARIHFPEAFASTHLYLLVRAGAERETLGTEALRTSKSFSNSISALRALGKNITPTGSDRLVRAKHVPGVGDVRVTALSPSDHAMMAALKQFADFVEHDLPAGRRPIERDPNLSAVALWVQWGPYRIVLGSDLVQVADERVGWKAAIRSQVLIADKTKAIIVKVPHHGSANGHSQVFWDAHVNAHVGGLTTYAAGISAPPQASDVARLKRHCQVVLCAPKPMQPPKPKGKATTKVAESQGIKVTPCAKRFGHVRIRINANGNVESECFGDAGAL